MHAEFVGSIYRDLSQLLGMYVLCMVYGVVWFSVLLTSVCAYCGVCVCVCVSAYLRACVCVRACIHVQDVHVRVRVVLYVHVCECV